MLADLQFYADLHEQCRDPPETLWLVRKHTNHSRPSTDFLVDPLQAVGSPIRLPVLQRK